MARTQYVNNKQEKTYDQLGLKFSSVLLFVYSTLCPTWCTYLNQNVCQTYTPKRAQQDTVHGQITGGGCNPPQMRLFASFVK